MAGRVLIYDAIAANRILLRCKLSAACYEVGLARSYADVAARLAADQPDILLLDLDQDAARARALCSAARRAGRPAVLCLADAPDRAQRQAALAAGAMEVLAKPVHDGFLMAALRRILRARGHDGCAPDEAEAAEELSLAETGEAGAMPARVAIVDTLHGPARQWPARLAVPRSTPAEPWGMPAEIVPLSADEALAGQDGGPTPDIYVLRALPDSQASLSLLSELRSRAATFGARIVVVLDAAPAPAEACRTAAAMAYDLGADEVLAEGFDAAELSLRIGRCLAAKRESDRRAISLRAGARLAARDPLTGLYNRRYALPRLHRMLETVTAQGSPLALLALDLDRFKAINDSRGHAAGDAVLVDVARRIGEALQPRDLAARSGGEEFWIALPGAGNARARAVARGLCRSIRASPVALPGRVAPVRVTASIGVAVAEPGTGPLTLEALLARADRALYDAKAGGRDTVTVAGCAA